MFGLSRLLFFVAGHGDGDVIKPNSGIACRGDDRGGSRPKLRFVLLATPDGAEFALANSTSLKRSCPRLAGAIVVASSKKKSSHGEMRHTMFVYKVYGYGMANRAFCESKMTVEAMVGWIFLDMGNN